jgi:uncharacterized membrane protein HdeD (DUF308 family)
VVSVSASTIGSDGRKRLARRVTFGIRAVVWGGLAIFAVVELAVGQTWVAVGVLGALVVAGGLALLIYNTVGRTFSRERTAPGVGGRAQAPSSASERSLLRVAEVMTRVGVLNAVLGLVIGLISRTVSTGQMLVLALGIFMAAMGVACLVMGLAWRHYALRRRPTA